MDSELSGEKTDGIASSIKDTFEVNVIRKWGQGLQDGAKRGLGLMSQLLDENYDKVVALGDQLYEIGSTLSNNVADGVQEAVDTAMDLFGSAEFKNASLGGKARMLWDAIIADPFTEWWDSKGQSLWATWPERSATAWANSTRAPFWPSWASTPTPPRRAASTVGARFAEGFLEDLTRRPSGEGIKERLRPGGQVGQQAHPRREKADAGSYLSGALLAMGGAKLVGMGQMAGGLFGGVKGLAGAAAGSQKAAGSPSFWAAATWPVARLSAGALGALGVGAAAGGVMGSVGLVSALSDLTKALGEGSSKGERASRVVQRVQVRHGGRRGGGRRGPGLHHPRPGHAGGRPDRRGRGRPWRGARRRQAGRISQRPGRRHRSHQQGGGQPDRGVRQAHRDQ